MKPVDGLTVTSVDLGVCNLHLVSGEDIIGHTFTKIDPETGGQFYVVKKPVIPNIAMGQKDGQPTFRVGLLPLRPYLGNLPEVEIATVYVMYPVKVNAQMEQMYLEFTTGITLASPGDVPKIKLS